MNIEQTIQSIVQQAIKHLYNIEFESDKIQIQKTRKEFEGDLTVVTFPLVKAAKKAPEAVGQELGEYLQENNELIVDFNVIKGFLNLSINKNYWIKTLNAIRKAENYGANKDGNGEIMMVEYASPNTNKPLHLGHIRNVLLGHSIAEIQKKNGWKVVSTNIVNDRGIHICKSMLAWQKFGNGETPENSGMKGDHLVGKYYVKFDEVYKAEIKALKAKNIPEEEAKKTAPILLEAQEMLRAWEDNDPEVKQLWETMNSWVYAGFDVTYEQIGLHFDKIYYESETYIDGRNKVEEGLANNIFFKREDGSVWVDLTAEGLDEKLLLRADGTSVYMTQDIGTAELRFKDYDIKKMVYVVGNEQEYHFQVLAVILDKLGFAWGKDLLHFSYGMVELPDGKMKSREGTVVDADDLMADMISTAKETARELGKLDVDNEQELDEISTMVGLGALKYFILKVDPRRNMLFNPKESIDFNGHTGPFIQYTHARIKSVLRKAAEEQALTADVELPEDLSISDKESDLIQLLGEYPNVIREAGREFSPALIANYVYELVKEYNQFYHDFFILREENPDLKNFRIVLSAAVADVVKSAMKLLGIDVPERM